MNTEILVITDRSGSMSNIANDVIGGYNKFIEEQKKEEGECRVTFTQFDNCYEVVYIGKDIKDVPPLTSLTYVPRGGTALLDAIGITFNAQGKRIAEEKWADLVVVVIITDGEENSSHEYTNDQIKVMTKHAEDHGWELVFLAANQDAFTVSQNLGMSGKLSGTYTASAAGTQSLYSATSMSVSSLRKGEKLDGLKGVIL